MFVTNEGLLICLSPDTNALVTGDGHEVVTNTGHSDSPDLSEESIKDKHFFISVSVNHLDFLVLGCCEDVMCLSDETDRCDGILVNEETLVDITELHTPDFEVLIGRAGREEVAIR